MLKNTFKLSPDGEAGVTTTADTTPANGDVTATATATGISKEQFDALQAELAKVKKANDDLAKEAAEKKRQLKDKMTAEEIAAAEKQTMEQELEALKASIEESKLSANKAIAETVTSTVKELADIKDDDKEFSVLVHSLTSTDKDNTTKLATYLAKIVKQAYDKGVIDTKADGTSQTADGVVTGGTTATENSDYKAYQASQKKPQAIVDLTGNLKKGD